MIGHEKKVYFAKEKASVYASSECISKNKRTMHHSLQLSHHRVVEMRKQTEIRHLALTFLLFLFSGDLLVNAVFDHRPPAIFDRNVGATLVELVRVRVANRTPIPLAISLNAFEKEVIKIY